MKAEVSPGPNTSTAIQGKVYKILGDNGGEDFISIKSDTLSYIHVPISFHTSIKTELIVNASLHCDEYGHLRTWHIRDAGKILYRIKLCSRVVSTFEKQIIKV